MKVIMSRALSSGQIERYHEEAYSRGDYYSQDGHTPGAWSQDAAVFGLSGTVEGAHISAIAQGRHSLTGEQLVSGVYRDGQEVKRAAFDISLTADKPVSLQAEVDPRINPLIFRVNTGMLREFKRFVQVRTDGGQSRAATGILVAASYPHDVARQGTQGKSFVAPHIHFHNVVLNVSVDKNGRARAIDPDQLYKAQKFASAWATVEMAKGLRKLGYQVKLKNESELTIVGYTREAVERFSPRHQEIVGKGGREMDRANEEKLQRNTRDRKTNLTPEERQHLRNEVIAGLKELGVDPEKLYQETLERGPVLELNREERGKLAAKSVGFSTEHRAERVEIVDTREFERQALRRGGGKIDINDIRAEIRTVIERESLHLGVLRSGAPALITREMLHMQKENDRIMLAGMGNGSRIGTPETLDRYIADYRHPEHGYGFGEDQGRVIRGVFGSKHQFIFLEGKAGAAKTTTIGGIVIYAENQNFELRGFGPTTAAVRALKEAGVKNVVTAQSLQHSNERGSGAARQEIWIADESSLWSTSMAYDLMRRAEMEGPAYVLWTGDSRQHRAVEAGLAVPQMERAAHLAGMEILRLDIIRRQKDPELRAAIDAMASGHMVEGYERLDRLGRITDVAGAAKTRGIDPTTLMTEEKRGIEIETVAEKYIEGERTTGSALVVTSTHADRKADNEAIRRLKVEAGEISREGYTTTIYSQVDRTKAERQWAGAYTMGDRLVYNYKSRAMHIEKGETGVVISIEAEHNHLLVKLDSGREVSYDPMRLSGVSVYLEEERQFAPGDSIITTRAYKEQGIANGDIGKIKEVSQDGKAVVFWQAVGSEPARIQEIDLHEMRGIDYGFAATSQHLQGLQTGTAVVHSPRDAKAGYVGPSRGVYDIQVVTSDREVLMEQVQRIQVERSAVSGAEAAKREMTEERRGEIDPDTSLLAQYLRVLGLSERVGSIDKDIQREQDGKSSLDGKDEELDSMRSGNEVREGAEGREDRSKSLDREIER